jgi:heme-degrading monooxygenase HmoA
MAIPLRRERRAYRISPTVNPVDEDRRPEGMVGLRTPAERPDRRSRRGFVIARIWRGWTRAEDTEAYAAYIRQTGITAYEATPGNRGAYLISRPDGDRTEFLTVSFWDDDDAIVAFAGADIDQAVFYPEDDRYLVDRETTVRHFTVH